MSLCSSRRAGSTRREEEGVTGSHVHRRGRLPPGVAYSLVARTTVRPGIRLSLSNPRRGAAWELFARHVHDCVTAAAHDKHDVSSSTHLTLGVAR